MTGKYAMSLGLTLLMMICGSVRLLAQTDQIEHNWYNQEKTAKVQIFKAKDGKFYGKIVWLKVTTENGKPRVDVNNPDKNKRNQPLMGLLLLKGFTKENDNVYEDGTIYDPKNGKTYSCKMTYKGNQLDVRGYIGISMMGRTTTWTKAD